LLLLGGNGLVSFAEQRVPSGVAALMVGSVPLWLVLIEALRPAGVRPTWQAIVGLLVGFGGIFLLIGPGELVKGSAQFDLVGIGILAAAAFLWALGSIYSRSADMPKSSLMATGAEMLCGSGALFIVSALLGEGRQFNFAAISTPSWLGLAYLVTFGSLVGFVAYGWLLQNAPVSLVATYAYVNPLVAVFLGNLFAQEPLNGRILLAAGIIIGSVVFINSARKPKVVEEAAASVAD
jgi:drug/metabolite transporter (DMT)-like permease